MQTVRKATRFPSLADLTKGLRGEIHYDLGALIIRIRVPLKGSIRVTKRDTLRVL